MLRVAPFPVFDASTTTGSKVVGSSNKIEVFVESFANRCSIQEENASPNGSSTGRVESFNKMCMSFKLFPTFLDINRVSNISSIPKNNIHNTLGRIFTSLNRFVSSHSNNHHKSQ